jgi:acyl-ACP thioesterase
VPVVLEPLAPLPTTGRVFERSRRVRLGDVSPAGRLRFDGLTRYLQDLSDDDTRDAGMSGEMTWVVRRTVVDVSQFPVLGEELALQTFCSATGPRWAERRVRLTGDRGGSADAATLWVFVDERGRPAPLPDGFMATFGEAAAGRTVRAKLTLPDPPELGATTTAWPSRFTDFDVLGHMNNAAYWSAVEEVLSARRHLRARLRATVEFRTAVEAGASVSVTTVDAESGVAIWLTGGGTVFAAAAVERTL